MKRRYWLKSLAAVLLPANVVKAATGDPVRVGRFVSVENGDRGILIDANGIQIPKPVAAYLDTGWVQQFRTNEHGSIVIENGYAEREWKLYPAPLLFSRSIRWN